MSGNQIASDHIMHDIDETIDTIQGASLSFNDAMDALAQVRSLLRIHNDFLEVFCREEQGAASCDVECGKLLGQGKLANCLCAYFGCDISAASQDGRITISGQQSSVQAVSRVIAAILGWLDAVEVREGKDVADSTILALSLLLPIGGAVDKSTLKSKCPRFDNLEPGLKMLSENPDEKQVEAFALGVLYASIGDRLIEIREGKSPDCYVSNALEVIWLQNEFDLHYSCDDEIYEGILQERSSAYLSYLDGAELARALAGAMHCRVEVLSDTEMKFIGPSINIDHARSLYAVLVRTGHKLGLLKPKHSLKADGYQPLVFVKALALIIDYGCNS